MVHTQVDQATGESHTHDSGAKVYGLGESWYETPGYHHVRSENAGNDEASFLANLVVHTDVFKGLDVKARSEEEDFTKIGLVFIIDKDIDE
ncbi:hypothetical protein FACUT_13989 [Fusarium acutatum]|uniref:Uncharacterized protein n=1 Tax=Fusarium acutatum TaxID=78861 RepID=A0A8H4J975_9HYPO|nr:hypothetical protein FACUT_13989 [Fusarium acutatum]